jgi:hypothetical protein
MYLKLRYYFGLSSILMHEYFIGPALQLSFAYKRYLWYWYSHLQTGQPCQSSKCVSFESGNKVFFKMTWKSVKKRVFKWVCKTKAKNILRKVMFMNYATSNTSETRLCMLVVYMQITQWCRGAIVNICKFRFHTCFNNGLPNMPKLRVSSWTWG